MKDFPPSTQVIPKKFLKADKKGFLEIYKCQTCTLLQLHEKLDLKKSYYGDYLIDRNYSTFSNRYQDKLAHDFIEHYSLKNTKILEVGCGDGFFAELLKKNGANVVGIDPSENACKATRERGIQAVCKYVNDDLKLDKEFSAFTLCQVLEHIRTPQNFLKKISSLVVPDGVGLIEVPSLPKTLNGKRFSDFFPDHVAYYDIASLSYLLKLAGFEILNISQSMNDEFLTAFVRVKRETKSLQKDFSDFQGKAESFVKTLKNKNIIAWGAGIRGISILSYSLITDKTFEYCIDSDPKKQGKFLPGSHLKVVSPEELFKKDYDVVIVSAELYIDEIAKLLRKKYNYKNKIAVLFPEPKFI